MNDEHARAAFVAYSAAVGGVQWDGRPIAGWDAQSDTVRAGWRAAALAARGEQREPAAPVPPNAGPPLVHRG